MSCIFLFRIPSFTFVRQHLRKAEIILHCLKLCMRCNFPFLETLFQYFMAHVLREPCVSFFCASLVALRFLLLLQIFQLHSSKKTRNANTFVSSTRRFGALNCKIVFFLIDLHAEKELLIEKKRFLENIFSMNRFIKTFSDTRSFQLRIATENFWYTFRMESFSCFNKSRFL